MTRAPASSVRKRIGKDPFVRDAWRPMQPARLAPRAFRSVTRSTAVPALSELRRARNRQNIGLIAELRCECTVPNCRETFPAAADGHRGAAERFIVAPAHLNGDTAVKVADRFFVIESRR
jgi:hypothetical protein